MRIQVSEGDREINIRIPTALVFNRITAMVAICSIKKRAPDRMRYLSHGKICALFAEFRRIRQMKGSWELVNVEAADGKKVKIIL